MSPAASHRPLTLPSPSHPPLSLGVPFIDVCFSRQDNGQTPLHCVAAAGQVAVGQYLVETAKADVNAADVSGAC